MEDHETPTQKLRDSLSSLRHEPSRVFPSGFMRKHTEYEDFQQFLDQQGWLGSKGSVPYEITVGNADEVVRETTDFGNWAEMVSAAQESLWEDPHRNRRRFRRYDCNVEVTFEVGVNDAKKGTLVDVSKNGLGLTTDEPVPSARTLTVKLPVVEDPLSPNSLEVRGAIRWRDDGATVRLGVELLERTG